MTLGRFVEKWTHPDYPPVSVSEAELRLAEERFGVRLPQDYRQAILKVGLPRPSIALLDAIVERKLDLFDVNDFYSPSEMIEDTLGWREISMPDNLIAFASDCSGNKFCFDENQLRKGTAASAVVWFFDHDFETVEAISPSFEAWVGAFCDVEPWSEVGPG